MNKRIHILLLLLFLLSAGNIQAQRLKKLLIDTTDNALDASKWLSTVTGFVPIIMPITEPAIGYGLGGGLIFFHPNEYRAAAKEGRLDNRLGEKISPTPPSITGAGGFYTENGSWGAGVGHLSVLRQDKIRYSISAGGGSINLDYYRKGVFAEHSRRFNIKVLGLTNEITFRLFESNWWGGLGYSFAKLNIEFDKIYNWTKEDLNKKETRNGVLSPVIVYDNRDNIFTPNKGVKIYAQYGYHDKWLGGTEAYNSLNTYFHGYIPIAPGHVTAIRFDTKSVFGDPTFVYKPYLVMRGLPTMKYQNDNASLVELEQRVALFRRWSIVAFGGIGITYIDFSDIPNEDIIYSYGTGVRYYLAKKYGLQMGLDFAWGPDDFAFYITFGSGWFRL